MNHLETNRTIDLKIIQRKYKKSWIYRPKGRNNSITIGDADKLTETEARAKVFELYLPPLQPTTLTVADGCALWLSRHAQLKRKTWREDKRRIEKWIVPIIGHRCMKAVTRACIVDLHNQISESGRVEANRVLGLIRAIYNRLIDWELIAGNNPASRIEKHREHYRERVVRDEELQRLLMAISGHDLGDAFLLMLACGLRKSEALRARWEDLRQSGELTLRHTKNGKDHVVWVPDWLMVGLEERRKAKGWIFVSPVTGSHYKCCKRAWRTICEGAGVKGLTMHDLRRTFATLSLEGGATVAQVSKALNHSSIVVTERYIHQRSEEAKKVFKIAEGIFGRN